MSNWTHVAAVVRVDQLRLSSEDCVDFEKIFGKRCHWDDSPEVWRDMEASPDRYLFMGSEGSLDMSVWTNPDLSCLSAYTVTIFGDLRDSETADKVVEWFKQKVYTIADSDSPDTSGLIVRQATITAENERNGTIGWTYDSSNKV